MDWDSDPELKAMRDEFVASLDNRRTQLVSFQQSLRDARGESQREAAEEICRIAHSLAGTAETYGFPILTRVSAALDDYLSESGEAKADPLPAKQILEFSGLLVDALEKASCGADPAEIESDPRYRALKEAAPDEPTSGA